MHEPTLPAMEVYCMKYRHTFVAVALFLLVSQNIYATCSPTINGPFWSGGSCWRDYVFDTSCADTSQSTTTLSCYSTPGHNFDYVSPGGEAFASYTFTASGSGSSTWSVFHRVDFNDPNNSQWDFVWLQVAVTHNGSTTYNTYFSYTGAMGDLSCSQPWTTFSAVNGDTVTFTIGTQALYSGTTIRVSKPYVSRNC